MVLRLGLAAGLDLDDVAIVGHVVVVDVDDRALAAFALPRPQLDFCQARKVMVFVDFYPFVLEPFSIGIDYNIVFEPLFGGLGYFHVSAKHYHGKILLCSSEI